MASKDKEVSEQQRNIFRRKSWDRASFHVSSDSLYDHCCTICAENNVNKVAKFYCSKCQKQFCDSCLKNHEMLHRDHTVLDRNGIKQWGQVYSQDYTELCADHTWKEIEVFCEDHQALCCSTCMAVNHR